MNRWGGRDGSTQYKYNVHLRDPPNIYNNITSNVSLHLRFVICEFVFLNTAVLLFRKYSMQLYLKCLTCIHWRIGGSPGAFDRGWVFSVASGAGTKLPVTSKPESIHLSTGGREGHRVLPNNCTIVLKIVKKSIIAIYLSRWLFILHYVHWH